MGQRPAVIDAYDVLGVSPRATPEELKAAHRKLVRRHHPDLVPPEEREAATRLVQEINVAYGLVRDRASRAEYDRVRTVYRQVARVEDTDRHLAQLWDDLLGHAGRWAGVWWKRNRRSMQKTAGRAAHAAGRAGRRVVGRMVWVSYCVVGALVGVIVAISVGQAVLDDPGATGPVVGVLAGLMAGSDLGTRKRLRILGAPAPPRHAIVVPLVAAALVAASLALDQVI